MSSKKVVAGWILVGYAGLQSMRSAVTLLGDIDFLFERLKEPRWIGKMLEMLLQPAPWSFHLLVLIVGVVLVVWAYKRTPAGANATIISSAPESFRGNTQKRVLPICFRDAPYNGTTETDDPQMSWLHVEIKVGGENIVAEECGARLLLLDKAETHDLRWQFRGEQGGKPLITLRSGAMENIPLIARNSPAPGFRWTLR